MVPSRRSIEIRVWDNKKYVILHLKKINWDTKQQQQKQKEEWNKTGRRKGKVILNRTEVFLVRILSLSFTG